MKKLNRHVPDVSQGIADRGTEIIERLAASGTRLGYDDASLPSKLSRSYVCPPRNRNARGECRAQNGIDRDSAHERRDGISENGHLLTSSYRFLFCEALLHGRRNCQ